MRYFELSGISLLSQVRAIYHTSIILAVTYYTRNVSYARGSGTGHPADYEVQRHH